MSFSRSYIAALGLVGTLVLGTGCAIENENADVDSQESELNSKSLARLGARKTVFDGDVTWQYTDRIGRGIEEQRDIGGHIKIEFLGAKRDALLDVWWQDAPAKVKYQPAIVTMDLPLATAPDVNQHVELLIGFQNGAIPEEPSFVVFDAKQPGAVAKFLAAYNPTTKFVQPGGSALPTLPSFSFYLKTDANGNVSPDATPPSNAATGIGTWPKVINFAWHTFTVHLLPE